MNDQGFTLTEMLVALVMLGLAIGGLAVGMSTMGELQLRATRTMTTTAAQRGAETSMARLVQDEGPFRSHDDGAFSGDGAGFNFRCAGAARCGARLANGRAGLDLVTTDAIGVVRTIPLGASKDAQFSYRGSIGPAAAWPPEGPNQVLRAIALIEPGAEGPRALTETRLWREHAADCVLDVVSQDCL